MQVQPNNRAMSKESAVQDERPNPPRFWWLKRGAIGFGLLLVMLCVLRFWWGHEAQRRIERIASAAHARGEPVSQNDLKELSIPDAENAAVPIAAAIGQLKIGGNIVFPEPTNGDAAAPLASELSDLDSMIGRYQSEIKLVRSARSRPSVVYPDATASSPLAPRNAEFNYYRVLSQILVLAANDEFAKGSDGAAVEYAHDAILLGDTFDRADQYPASHLVALAIDDLDLDFLQQVAMGISISNRPGQGASPVQVRSLIAALNDESAFSGGAIRASESEGMIAINFPPLSGLTEGRPLIDKILRPMEEFNGARIDEFESANAQAYGQTTFAAARSKLRNLAVGKQPAIGKLARNVAPFAYPPIAPIRVHFKTLVERRIAAITLAIRLYTFDHDGRLPTSLSELVPAYLPAVPRDPFDPADGTIRYLPTRNPPVLYSVGLNEKDDGGSERYMPTSEPVMPRWHNEDVVYPLQARPRISPAQDH